ncbi:hypothetical protein F0562_013812 [Nyssa sinensis]|uniref:non-specific serine/threonine protein kinase n=1 Tax=Nyssa sinensis TaxID=561372 RepID=A0A5J4ZNZ0_9ASTE|nr:hypothetical protein F0562_013812 [Nyssa sinensis]
MITFLFFLIIPFVTSLHFNFPNFGISDSDQSINCTGNAYISNQGIQVTPDPDERNDSSFINQTGRATYIQPLHLWDNASGKVTDFTTHFSFVIAWYENSSLGEGLAFFLAPNGSSIPPDSAGGRLGLANENQTNQLVNQTINPFVAVEFDTYRNNEWEEGTPINHVGIDISSMRSITQPVWWSEITNGKREEAWISYNSTTQNLSVSFTGFRNGTSLYYIVDLRNYLPEWVTFGFSAATGQNIFQKNSVISWEFNSSLEIDGNIKDSGDDENKTGLVVGLSAGSFVLVAGLALVGFVLWKRRDGREKGEGRLGFDPSMDNEFERGSGPKKFPYDELARATNNFGEELKLGEGGFGGVYRGFLRELNSSVAVKRISRGSKQGIKEYASEVRIISQLRHKNLVRLIEKNLNWVIRFKIAQGLASALVYLHEEWEQCVVHRDIKSSNVMLDSNFNAKLGDFGLARFVDHEKESETTNVAGTMGYMAPEYFVMGKASKESDVYSFGIVALEIACGRKAIDPKAPVSQRTMVEWVWNLYGMGKLLEAADPKLGADFDEEEMECLMIVGLWCAHPEYTVRPSIRQATRVLCSESPLPILPSKMPVPTSFAPSSTASMATSSLSSSYVATDTESSQIKSSSHNSNTISSTVATSSAGSSQNKLTSRISSTSS